MDHLKLMQERPFNRRQESSFEANGTYQKMKLFSSFEVYYPFCARAGVLREVQGQRFTSPKLIVLLFRPLKSMLNLWLEDR